MSIDYIFLDLGHVLFGLDYEATFKRVAERSAFSTDELMEQFMYNPIHTEFEHGRIDQQTFFSQIHEHLRFNSTHDELEVIWRELLYPHEANFAFAQELAKQYPVGVISNTNDAHARFFESSTPLKAFAKPLIYSHKVGCMKPEPAIYEAALDAVGCKAEQTVFIDDRAENIEAAKELGFKAFLFPKDACLRTFWQDVVLSSL